MRGYEWGPGYRMTAKMVVDNVRDHSAMLRTRVISYFQCDGYSSGFTGCTPYGLLILNTVF